MAAGEREQRIALGADAGETQRTLDLVRMTNARGILARRAAFYAAPVEIHDSGGGLGIDIRVAVAARELVKRLLDRADRRLRTCKTRPLLGRLLLRFRLVRQAVQQPRQRDARDGQRHDDHARRQEDRQIARRERPSVRKQQWQRDHTGERDRSTHAGEGHHCDQSP